MKTQIKILAKKTWHSVIIEYFMKDKDMNEVVSATDIIITFYTQEIIRHNKCQMRFL